ncbi:uncharacterized protein LOC117578597 [Drosophila guanche]|uniref:Blast:GPI ethanolamine phosphate transferase 2 n=1 Tax=Drosophila guanche TaxID=7266 RepID=A0A3B0JX93_DROGU|nr:uncharacterized protein LOC117578597 [Drosophila guanche]SPP75708.1 blast:GPI ethanolamine phosphate transferase 2 [Drosophila guanche]
MEVCGSVLVCNNYEQFRLKCIYCTIESDLKDWEQFTFHVRNAHYFEEEDDENIEKCWNEQDTPIEEMDSTIQYEVPQVLDEAEPIEEGEDQSNLPFCILEDEDWTNDETNENNIQYEEDNVYENNNTEVTYQEMESSEMAQASCNANVYEGFSSNCSQQAAPFDDLDNFSYDEHEEEWPKRFGRPPKRARPGQVYKLKVTFIRRNPRVLHLIEAYREHPCLWNPSDEQYENEEARSEAYHLMILRLDEKANVLFTEEELMKTIQQLHSQYTLAAQMSGENKLIGLAARYFAKCDFLRSTPCTTLSDDDGEEVQLDTIKLNFKVENEVTSAFIETYANYPVLYNTTHPHFDSVEERTRAYIRLAKEFRPVVLANDTDVYIAVQKLRKWAYEAMRRMKAKELIKACSPQELQYLQMCSFLPVKPDGHIWYCENCGKRFHGDYNLRTHMFKQHNIGEPPYLCSQCPRRFERQHDMEKHILRAHSERKFQCKFCDKFFPVECDLKVHLKVHTGERPYVCEMCGKGFRLKLLLDHHVNGVHLNIRPFKCSMCEKSFRKKFELMNHLKGHLNIRDKKCDKCDATFYDHSSLSRHRRFNHRNKFEET